MTDRIRHLQKLLGSKSKKGIEIAPAHNPVCPKKDGWDVISVDVFDTDQLKYELNKGEILQVEGQIDLYNVEEVDVVWKKDSLENNFSKCEYGRYDFIVASHVLEHIPNLIGFLNSAKILLKNEGILVYALPDKNLIFDYFRPYTILEEVVHAYQNDYTRHDIRTCFHTYFNTCWHKKYAAWNEYGLFPTQMQNSFDHGYYEYFKNLRKLTTEYVDMHCWAFSKSSWELLIGRMRMEGWTTLGIKENMKIDGVRNEFFGVLSNDIDESFEFNLNEAIIRTNAEERICSTAQAKSELK